MAESAEQRLTLSDVQPLVKTSQPGLPTRFSPMCSGALVVASIVVCDCKLDGSRQFARKKRKGWHQCPPSELTIISTGCVRKNIAWFNYPLSRDWRLGKVRQPHCWPLRCF